MVSQTKRIKSVLRMLNILCYGVISLAMLYIATQVTMPLRAILVGLALGGIVMMLLILFGKILRVK